MRMVRLWLVLEKFFTGIDQAQLFRLMSGEEGVSMDNLERLAEASVREVLRHCQAAFQGSRQARPQSAHPVEADHPQGRAET
jgi:hypothetical protein